MTTVLIAALLQPALADADPGTITCDGTPSCVADLRDVIDLDEVGVDVWLGEAAKAAVQRMDEAHDAAMEDDGRGLYYGNKLNPEGKDDLSPQDCTTFVLEVIGQAFRAAGLEDEWMTIFEAAVENSGEGGFKGIELMKALQEHGGWQGAYFNPDVSHPRDASDEHPYSAYLAEKNGSYYGVGIDHMVVDYEPTYGSKTVEDEAGLEWLKGVPFGVVAARGGKHMAMIVDGDIYEVHWYTGEWSKDVITQEGFESWEWLSGAIVFPTAQGVTPVEAEEPEQAADQDEPGPAGADEVLAE